MESNIADMQGIQKPTQTEETYTKEAILRAKEYSIKKDLVNALLEDDKKYTIKQVDSIINKYLKGVIK